MDTQEICAFMDKCFKERKTVIAEIRDLGRLHLFAEPQSPSSSDNFYLAIPLPLPMPDHGATGKPFDLHPSAISSVEEGIKVNERVWHQLVHGTTQSGTTFPVHSPREF